VGVEIEFLSFLTTEISGVEGKTQDPAFLFKKTPVSIE